MIQRWWYRSSSCWYTALITNSVVRNTCHLRFYLSSSSSSLSSHALVLFFLTAAAFPVCTTFSVHRHPLPFLVGSTTYGDHSWQNSYSRETESRMVSTRSRTVALRSRRFKEEEGETGDSERNGIIVTPESIKTNVASDVKQRKIRNKKITSTALNSTNANKPNQYNGIIDINRSVVLESYGGNDSTIPDFSSFTFQTTPDKQQLSHNWLNFDNSKNDDYTKLTFETSSPDFATPSIDTKLSFPLPSSSSKTNKRKKTVHQETTSKTKEADKIEPPIGWEDIYSIVEELRSDRTAPVDLCGPAVIIEKHLGEKVFRFQVLIALMLSSQTKDNVVCDAMKKLQRVSLHSFYRPFFFIF